MHYFDNTKSFTIVAFTLTLLLFVLSVETKVAVIKDDDTSIKKCFSYGCPITPEDLIQEHVQVKFGYVSNDDKNDESLLDSNDMVDELDSLEEDVFVQAATLTLTGYKGGAIEDQINQDRALIVAPFYPVVQQDYLSYEAKRSKENAIVSNTEIPFENMLLGVFDGHGKGGEIVSQFVVEEIPTRILNAFSTAATLSDEMIQSILNETFVELDRDAPVGDSGGCTASLLLKLKSKLFIANTGDSRTFVAAFDPKTNSSDIVYITREDKPELPEERKRVEKMGGTVYIPPPEKPHASSRVIYVDYKTGYRNGLAMSRSIGDRAFGKRGVIPDPLIHIIDLESAKINASKGECIIDESGDETCFMNDGLKFYVVSGTDGLFDELKLDEITDTIGPNLFHGNGENLMRFVSDLVVIAAQRWGHRYRDDIAITVARLT